MFLSFKIMFFHEILNHLGKFLSKALKVFLEAPFCSKDMTRLFVNEKRTD